MEAGCVQFRVLRGDDMHDYRRVLSARRIIKTIVLPSGNEPRGLIDGGWVEFQAPGQVMRSWRGSALGRAGLWTKWNSPLAGMRSQWRRGNSVHVFDAGRPLVGSPSWLIWRRLPVNDAHRGPILSTNFAAICTFLQFRRGWGFQTRQTGPQTDHGPSLLQNSPRGLTENAVGLVGLAPRGGGALLREPGGEWRGDSRWAVRNGYGDLILTFGHYRPLPTPTWRAHLLKKKSENSGIERAACLLWRLEGGKGTTRRRRRQGRPKIAEQKILCQVGRAGCRSALCRWGSV